MHLVVRSYLAAQRQGTQSALTRGEVRGGGRKIYRQKGTGNARHHGNRAPQFKHGGVVFAPKPRDYVVNVNKKVRRLAFRSAMTAKFNAGEIIVVDSLTLKEAKTKLMAETLKKLSAEKKALVVLPERDENVVRATANLAQAKTTYVNTLNVYDILNAGKVVLTKAAKESGADVEIIFANHATAVLDYAKRVLTCDIHTRARSKRLLKAAGAEVVCGLDDILNAPLEREDGSKSGFNAQYGLLGSNKSTEDVVKLFPHDATAMVNDIAKKLHVATGKNIEVMVYGDGAFKDPQGKIWELADPVVSPAHTDGLKGTPNELKLKYLADNDFKDLSGEALKEAISKSIREKDGNLVGNMASQGTTPRQLTDLIGSLCDLTSGSGDKGTPVVLVQGYFDNFTAE